MQSFTQHSPTEVVFGRGTENQTAALVKKYGGSKVLIVYGSGSVEHSGLLGNIEKQLTEAGITFIKHGGAVPNPHLSHAREGVKKAIEAKVDAVLAIGGGSAIDAAKAIAHGAANPGIDIWKFWLREENLTKSLPVGVILTISAAGSETSNSSVITNTETAEKRGFLTDFNRPRFAIMNPEQTFTLPKDQLANGVADIMMHTMERYFTSETVEGKPNEMTDEIAEGLLRVVIKNGTKILENPANYDAQSEIMWAGSLSHNGITGLGRTMDFSVHALGHELSGKFDVAHGKSLTAMWGAWARHVKHISIPRFAQYARKVWGVTASDDNTAADEGIIATEKYFNSIGMPINFTELGIGKQTDEILQDLAHRCVFYGARKIGTFSPLEESAVLEIYKAVNH